MTRDETATDSEPGAESLASPEDSGPEASDSGTSMEAPDVSGATAVHWLVRVAERAGLEGERPDVPPGRLQEKHGRW